tara:strand:- start:85 stop:585 length:501 start_codon:yes stop_codon:yes gene_type:complete
MTRSTAEELGTRIEEAADLLSEGWPGRYVVKTLAEKHQVSHQQARKYVREGRHLLVESVAPQDRAAMFSQVLACLQQDRMDAKEAGNISAQVGASKAMVNHLKQIAHIDPMRDWEQALGEHFAGHTVTKAKIPRSGIWEEERERKVQEGFDRLAIRITDPSTDQDQ